VIGTRRRRLQEQDAGDAGSDDGRGRRGQPAHDMTAFPALGGGGLLRERGCRNGRGAGVGQGFDDRRRCDRLGRD